MLTHPDYVTTERVLDGCTIDLLGLAVGLRAQDLNGAGALASLLRGARVLDGPAQVEIRACAHALAVPSTVAITRGSEFEMWRPDPGELVLRHRSGFTARVGDNALDVGGDAAPYAANFRRVFFTSLSFLAARHGRHVLHGAAIARDGHAILVLGGSGAGKSTLALCALRGGWDVMSDDLVGLRRVDHGLIVTGVPRPFAVPADLLDGGVETRATGGDHRQRRELPPHVISHGWYPIAGSLAVDHADSADGVIERLDAHARLHLLLGSWTPRESDDDFRGLLPLAAEIARMPGLRLRLGRDARTRVADAIALLAEVPAQFAAQP
jgi:hypothetical protein